MPIEEGRHLGNFRISVHQDVQNSDFVELCFITPTKNIVEGCHIEHKGAVIELS